MKRKAKIKDEDEGEGEGKGEGEGEDKETPFLDTLSSGGGAARTGSTQDI